MGLVPQEIAIYETLTAAENLSLFAKLCGVPAEQIPVPLNECSTLRG